MKNPETTGISGLRLIYPVRRGGECAWEGLRGSGLGTTSEPGGSQWRGLSGMDMAGRQGKALRPVPEKVYTGGKCCHLHDESQCLRVKTMPIMKRGKNMNTAKLRFMQNQS